MNTLPLAPIGTIHTEFKHSPGTPLHSVYAGDAAGTAVLDPAYPEGLRDIEQFTRVWLLFWRHRAKPGGLLVTPYRDTTQHGVFATRVPARPNPIGLSSVRLISVEGNRLHFAGADILDGSLLLDIKPYVSEYDSFPGESTGWVGDSKIAASTLKADERFERSDTE